MPQTFLQPRLYIPSAFHLPCSVSAPLTLLSISWLVGLQISAYRVPAWKRCAIMGQCAWSRTTSQCASALRPAHKRPTQCADLTATATAVPVRCERWVVPCRRLFTSNTKDPAVSNGTTKHHRAAKQTKKKQYASMLAPRS